MKYQNAQFHTTQPTRSVRRARPAKAARAVRLGRWLAAIVLCGAVSPAAIFDFSMPSQNLTAVFTGSSVSLSLGGQFTTNVPSGSTEDIRIGNGVVAWSSGATVYSYVFDPTRSRWMGTSSAQGPTFDLSSVDGVVAWSTSSGAFFRVYDPLRSNWVGGNGPGPVSEPAILNTHGVVAWSSGGSVYAQVYDPTRTGWRGNSIASSSIFDIQNVNGVVAWSANPRVNYQVYDPRRGQWMSGFVESGYTTDLKIDNSLVSWTTSSAQYFRGYNPDAAAWVSGAPSPLASFAVSTNSGNAPFLVLFIDLSIGGTAWTWNFGDGLGTSTQRSPAYRYTTFGRYTATQTVNGSSTNRQILTDTIAPSGTNVINHGASITTNALVTLTLSATDNSGVVADMRFSNDGLSWSAWEAYATTRAWNLAPGNGLKTVSAQFRDSASNTSATANASIQLDTTTPPIVSFLNTNVSESGGSVTVFVTLDHPYSQLASVRYATSDGTATAGADYTASSGLLTFPPGVTNASFTLAILLDSIVELNETVLLNFSAPTNVIPGPQGTVTIRDDDLATVSFATTNFSANENSGDATISVQLSAASGRTVVVSYLATNGTALAGTDFGAVQGLLTFAPGQTNATFTVPLVDDTLDELNETVRLTLTNATNAILGLPAAATLVIVDDDNPLVFFSSQTYPVFENIGVARVSVWLSKPFPRGVNVQYAAIGGTAAPGSDYAPTSGTLQFLPGQTNNSFFVTILPDTQAEPDETIHLTFGQIDGATPGATTEADVVIYDDDRGPRVSATRLTAGGHFQATFQGPAGQRFSVEISTDLQHWSTLGTLTNNTGTLDYEDPAPATLARRFYRTSLSP